MLECLIVQLSKSQPSTFCVLPVSVRRRSGGFGFVGLGCRCLFAERGFADSESLSFTGGVTSSDHWFGRGF